MRGRRRARDGSSGRERAIAGEGGVGGVMGGGFFLQLNLVKIHVTTAPTRGVVEWAGAVKLKGAAHSQPFIELEGVQGNGHRPDVDRGEG